MTTATNQQNMTHFSDDKHREMVAHSTSENIVYNFKRKYNGGVNIFN